MPTDQIEIESIGPVKLTRRRGQKRIVLRVNGNGEVVVSAPLRTPKYVITNFVKSKQSWLAKQIDKHKPETYQGGDSFRAGFEIQLAYTSKRNSSKAINDTLVINLNDQQTESEEQAYIIKSINKELKQRAEAFLPDRLLRLSEIFNLPFNQVRLKNLRSRWGSCTAQKNINLNIQLMNLPSELIDHVLLHELAHTVHLSHSQDFWNKLAEMDPDYKIHRKSLKTFDTHRPIRHN